MTLGRVCNQCFIIALNRLADQRTLLSGKDSYALARTMDQLEPELKAHGLSLNGLMRKHGARGSLDDLRAAAAKLASARQPGDVEPKSLTELNQKIAALEPQERLEITPADPGWEAFSAELAELEAGPVELYLDHKIPVRVEAIPAGALSAQDLRQLKDIVEFIEAAAPPANAENTE